MIKNKRELGGIPTEDGKTVKHGYFFRSAGLADAERKDLEGISLIIDLRTDREREESPDKTYDVRYLPMPVFNEVTAGISHEKGVEKNGFPNMKYLYGWMVEDRRETFGAILKKIMKHDYSTGGVLWHCSGGKDRTGIIAAFILEMLGADRRIIMDDYLKTNEVMLPEAEKAMEYVTKKHGKDFAASLYQAMVADRDYLEASWQAMDDDYFSSIGITEEDIAEFRNEVLE